MTVMDNFSFFSLVNVKISSNFRQMWDLYILAKYIYNRWLVVGHINISIYMMSLSLC
jgi:hypothetical protein